MYEVIILAAIALFVLSRLYIALGRDDGQGDRPRPSPAPATARGADAEEANGRPREKPVFTGPAAGALEEIYAVDPSFDTRDFMRGAKSAYEMIVDAFARGDRKALRPLLDDDVYDAWDHAIAKREADGAAPFELLRLKNAEIEDASLEDGVARIIVRYEAELGDGERTRMAKELWTFMRTVASSDPNWKLDDVETA